MENYYGSLCTKMYEILHVNPTNTELAFYFSFANKGDIILEPLCGSGRFLIPFMEKGFDITGFDLSEEMINQLVEKKLDAKVFVSSMEDYHVVNNYDYIFIPSGSFSLFVSDDVVVKSLKKMKESLSSGGKFVFAVETINTVENNQSDYEIIESIVTKDGMNLVYKSKNHFDPVTKIQSSPSLYELYYQGKLLREEIMDYKVRLYNFGELDEYIRNAGFKDFNTYTSFENKDIFDPKSETVIYECIV